MPLEWVQRLRRVVEELPPPPPPEEEGDEQEARGEAELFKDWAAARPPGNEGSIPRLCPPQNDFGELEELCRTEERDIILHDMRRAIPSTDAVWTALAEAADPSKSTSGNVVLSSYGSYRAAAMRVVGGKPYYRNPYMTPHMFFLSKRSVDDPADTSALPIFAHITRKALLSDIRMQLEMCDTVGEGYVTEVDLEVFIEGLMPNMRTVRKLGYVMGGHYQVFYKCHAVRKFFFFLDPSRRGRISIDAVMDSEVFLEFIKLCQLETAEDTSDEDLPEDLADNWFTFQIMQRVYQHYVELDGDWNGMLSIDEMLGYNNASFIPLFIQRVFEVYPTQGYRDEIDFKSYLNFVLATENTQTPAAAHYFWRLLDIGNCGLLAHPHVTLFAKELAELLGESGLMAISPDDIVREVFDMVNPKNPEYITLEDILECGQMGTVLSILVDYRAFYNYDSRETVLAANSQAHGEEEEEEGENEASLPSAIDANSSGDTSLYDIVPPFHP